MASCSCTELLTYKAVIVIYDTLLVDLPKNSQGIGFTPSTRQAANELVDNDSLLLQCHVTRIECSADNVIIVQSNSPVYGRTSNETERFTV